MSGLRRYAKLGIQKGVYTSSDGAWQLPYKVVSPQGQTSKLRPILLLQGWTGQANDWGSFPQVLAAATARPVVLYDQRYVGHSKRLGSALGFNSDSGTISTNISLSDLTADAVGIAKVCMEVVGGSGVVPFGFSFGGVVAQKMIESGLGVDVQTAILCASWRQFDRSLFNDAFLTCFDNWDKDSLDAARRFFRMGLTEEFVQAKPDYVDMLAKNFLETRGESFAEAVELQKQCLISDYGLEERYNGDCLLLHGDSDRTVYPQSSVRIKRAVNGLAEMKTLAGCGHFVWSTHAVEICAAIEAYLKGKL